MFFLLTLAVVPAVLGVAAWTSQESPVRVDRYCFEQIGMCLLNGGTEYVDCWDNKPPLLFWINAGVLALGNGSTMAITVACWLAACLAVIATHAGMKRVFGRGVATAGALLLTLMLAQRGYDGLTNGTELYAMVGDAFAAVFIVGAIRRQGWSALLLGLLAGISWGLAGMTKQTGAAGPLAFFLACFAFITFGPRPRGQWLVRLNGVIIGAVLVLAVTAAILQHRDALEEGYFAMVTANWLAGVDHAVFTQLDAQRLWIQLEPLRGVLLLMLVGALVTFVQPGQFLRPRDERALPPQAVVFLVIWLLVAAYGVNLGFSHMTRYWHGAFIPMIWLAAQGLRWVGEAATSSEPRQRSTVLIGATVLGFLYFAPLIRAIHDDCQCARHYAESGGERGRLMELAEAIQQKAGPADRIYVWGYSPGIYRFAERAPASRFLGLDKTGQPDALADWVAPQLVEDLRTMRPAVIVVEANRLADLQADRAGVVHIVGLADWFASNYAEYAHLQGHRLFARTDRAGDSVDTPPSSDHNPEVDE
jgi:hypothetical protein